MLASLIANCKMSEVDPLRYLAETLRSLLDGHAESGSDVPMPWNFAPTSNPASQAHSKASNPDSSQKKTLTVNLSMARGERLGP